MRRQTGRQGQEAGTGQGRWNRHGWGREGRHTLATRSLPSLSILNTCNTLCCGLPHGGWARPNPLPTLHFSALGDTSTPAMPCPYLHGEEDKTSSGRKENILYNKERRELHLEAGELPGRLALEAFLLLSHGMLCRPPFPFVVILPTGWAKEKNCMLGVGRQCGRTVGMATLGSQGNLSLRTLADITRHFYLT